MKSIDRKGLQKFNFNFNSYFLFICFLAGMCCPVISDSWAVCKKNLPTDFDKFRQRGKPGYIRFFDIKICIFCQAIAFT